MQHFKHPLCNLALTPAPGTEDRVDTLHVQRGSMNGDACVRSFWHLSAQELRCLNQGGPVVLTVLGHTAPPVSLHVANPDQGVDDAFAHDEALLEELVRSADKDGSLVLNFIADHLREGGEEQAVKGIAKTYAMQMLRRYRP